MSGSCRGALERTGTVSGGLAAAFSKTRSRSAGLLERQAGEIMARLPAEGGVASDVRRVLAKQVAGGDTRITAVARELATTSRTLQRRLAAAGLSYQELLDRTRREAAEKYLADSSLAIAEVSYLLGYSEPSALHRASSLPPIAANGGVNGQPTPMTGPGLEGS